MTGFIVSDRTRKLRLALQDLYRTVALGLVILIVLVILVHLVEGPGSLGRAGYPDCLERPGRLGVFGGPGIWGNVGSPDSLCCPGSPGSLGSLGSANSSSSFGSGPASQPATVWLLALLQSGPAGSRSPDKATTVGVVI